MRSKTAFLLLLLSCVSFVSAQSLKTATKDEIQKAVNAVPCEQDDRLEGVKQQFREARASADEIKIETSKKGKISNVVVRKKGKTDETIVIGAHYDRTESGCGVTDNWTGIVILTQMYKTLAALTTQKSYVFVAFDKEETGLRGSSAMVGAMTPEQVANTCTMLNLDSFGQTAPMAVRSLAAPKLLDLAKEIGKQGGLELADVDIQDVSADSAMFRNKGIAAITISGIGTNWKEILHTPNDKVKNVNIDSVYIGYRFGLLFVARLDAAGCKDYN